MGRRGGVKYVPMSVLEELERYKHSTGVASNSAAFDMLIRDAKRGRAVANVQDIGPFKAKTKKKNNDVWRLI